MGVEGHSARVLLTGHALKNLSANGRRSLLTDEAPGDLARRCIYRFRRAGLDLSVGALLHSVAIPLSDQRWAWRCERSTRRLIRERGRPAAPLHAGIRRVELVGAPGVGKTTIIRLLVRGGEFRRLTKTVTNDELAAASGAYPAFEAVLRRIEHPRFMRAHLPSILGRFAMLRCASRESTGRVFVEDEGLLQRGLNLAQLKPRHEDFFDYYWTVPVPDALVLIRADPDRILTRNRERALESPKKDRGAQRFFASWVMDIAMSIVTARDVPCAVIENDGTPEAGASQIVDALRKLRDT